MCSKFMVLHVMQLFTTCYKLNADAILVKGTIYKKHYDGKYIGIKHMFTASIDYNLVPFWPIKPWLQIR